MMGQNTVVLTVTVFTLGESDAARGKGEHLHCALETLMSGKRVQKGGSRGCSAASAFQKMGEQDACPGVLARHDGKVLPILRHGHVFPLWYSASVATSCSFLCGSSLLLPSPCHQFP